mmetsp:Transcript_100829/g.177508  ORF Transcript_100829/g.177508 Transcript_100829/m.177508 type:complete len:151 (-) Transcript_100829:7-459(-)
MWCLRTIPSKAVRLPQRIQRSFAVGTGVGHSGHLSAELLRNQHDPPAISSKMSATDKYLFDLNGYIVLRGVLSEEEVAAANSAVEAHMDTLHERTGKLRTSGLYGRQSEALAGDGKTGRKDMGGMLGWAKPHCEPFRDFMCHPRLLPPLF